MLEILAIFGLSVWIRNITEPKGYKWGRYVILTIVLWLLGECTGLIIGWLVATYYSLRVGYIYLFALAGALLGGTVAVIIAMSLKPKEVVSDQIQLSDHSEVVQKGICSICGFNYKSGDRFCRKCGAAIAENASFDSISNQ
jgi:hypothetical protein